MESDDDNGPIIRTPRTPKGVDYSNYEDAVLRIDCAPFWRRMGLQRCFASPRDVWFVKDICGVICMIFTWLLLVYAEFVVFYVMLLPYPNPLYSLVNGVIFQCGVTLALCSHAKAMLTDPVSYASVLKLTWSTLVLANLYASG